MADGQSCRIYGLAMATNVPLESLSFEIERRIRARIASLGPDSPRLREGLLRIGLLIEAEAKLNIRRKGIIDTGRLINSIRHELFKEKSAAGVRVGSFGVPYAAIHEFGGPFTDAQRRAMFASLRDRGKLGPSRTPGKGVIQGNRFIARPYLRPAVNKNRGRIIDIVREMLRSKR